MSATDIFWHLLTMTCYDFRHRHLFWPLRSSACGMVNRVGFLRSVFAIESTLLERKKMDFEGIKIWWSRFVHGFWRDTIAVINVWLRFLCFFVSLFKCVLKWRSYVGPMSDFEYFDFEIFKANTWHVMMQQTSLRVHRILLWRSTTDFLRSAVLRQLLTPWCLLTTVLGLKKTVGDRRLHVFIQWWYIYYIYIWIIYLYSIYIYMQLYIWNMLEHVGTVIGVAWKKWFFWVTLDDGESPRLLASPPKDPDDLAAEECLGRHWRSADAADSRFSVIFLR